MQMYCVVSLLFVRDIDHNKMYIGYSAVQWNDVMMRHGTTESN